MCYRSSSRSAFPLNLLVALCTYRLRTAEKIAGLHGELVFEPWPLRGVEFAECSRGDVGGIGGMRGESCSSSDENREGESAPSSPPSSPAVMPPTVL